MWDQTVRGVNRGLTLDELTRFVQLPGRFDRTYFTRQFYGLVEHHVKQIHAGLFGWFDEDASKLFPLAPADRAQRLINGFGGFEAVRAEVGRALDGDDYRWAIELEGALDLARYRVHRFGYREVLASPPTTFIPVLRVLLDPDRAAGMAFELRWQFDTGESAGLKIRGQVAIPTDGSSASATLSLSHDTWALVLSGRQSLPDAIDAGLIIIDGEREAVLAFFSAFDLPGA